MEFTSAQDSPFPAASTVFSEIFYKVDPSLCATKQELWDVAPEIAQLKDAVEAQLIMQYIAFFGGFCLTLGAAYRDKIGENDTSEEDDSQQTMGHRLSYGFDFLLKVGKVIALSIAWVSVAHNDAVFGNAAACTDPTTASQGFAALADTVHKVQSNTVQNFVAEGLMMLMTCYSCYSVTAYSSQALADQAEAAEAQDAAEERAEVAAAKTSTHTEEVDMDTVPSWAPQQVQPQWSSQHTNPGPPPPPPPTAPPLQQPAFTPEWSNEYKQYYWVSTATGASQWERPPGYPDPTGYPNLAAVQRLQGGVAGWDARQQNNYA